MSALHTEGPRPACRTGQGYFATRDLVVIGVFAAAARVVSLMVALAGGAMDPVSIVLKSALWSALWLALLAKSPKVGVLTLANLIAGLIGLFLMGQAVVFLPAVVAASLLVEAGIGLTGGYRNVPVMAAAVAVSELLMRFLSLGLMYLAMREAPQFVLIGAVASALSYAGILIGLAGGAKIVRELKYAGLIQA